MESTYCGKSCRGCLYRRELSCSGCESTGHNHCPIARCCRSSRRDACRECSTADRCATLKNAVNIPKEYISRQTENQQLQAQQHARGIRLRKVFSILFALSVPIAGAVLLTSQIGAQLLPAFRMHAQVILFLMLPVTGAALLAMGSEENRFRRAGGLLLAAAGAAFLPEPFREIAVYLLLPAVEFFLFTGCKRAVSLYSKSLPELWDILLKWRLLIYIERPARWVTDIVSGIPGFFPSLAYPLYLMVMAMGYTLLLMHLWGFLAHRIQRIRLMARVSRKLPFKVTHLEYFLVLAAAILLDAVTKISPVLSPVAVSVLLLYTAGKLPNNNP